MSKFWSVAGIVLSLTLAGCGFVMKRNHDSERIAPPPAPILNPAPDAVIAREELKKRLDEAARTAAAAQKPRETVSADVAPQTPPPAAKPVHGLRKTLWQRLRDRFHWRKRTAAPKPIELAPIVVTPKAPTKATAKAATKGARKAVRRRPHRARVAAPRPPAGFPPYPTGPAPDIWPFDPIIKAIQKGL